MSVEIKLYTESNNSTKPKCINKIIFEIGGILIGLSLFHGDICQ